MAVMMDATVSASEMASLCMVSARYTRPVAESTYTHTNWSFRTLAA